MAANQGCGYHVAFAGVGVVPWRKDIDVAESLAGTTPRAAGMAMLPCDRQPVLGAVLRGCRCGASTILDGQAELLIGARSVVAAEGLRLGEGTLVDTSPRTTLMRLEWPDGSVLDLGPDTRVMLQPGALGRKGEGAPAFYLLQGWAKFRSAPAQGHPGFATQRVDVLPAKGSVVAFVEPARTWLFVESGDVRVAERDGKGRHNLASGALVRVLPAWKCPSLPLHLVTPTTRKRAARVQAFMDWAHALLLRRLGPHLDTR